MVADANEYVDRMVTFNQKWSGVEMSSEYIVDIPQLEETKQVTMEIVFNKLLWITPECVVGLLRSPRMLNSMGEDSRLSGADA